MSTSWQLAASTLGVVDEDLPTAVEILRRHGATAVELRSAEGAFVAPDSGASARAEVRRAFDDAGIEIFSVASGVRIAAGGDDDAVVASLLAELRLAADLGARFVRVFPGAPNAGVQPFDRVPELLEDAAVADVRAARRLVRTLDVATELGVSPLIETHDSHPRGADVARMLAALEHLVPDHPVGAIWDVLHPWRVGEDMETTAAALAPYVLAGRGYVQIKDVPSAAELFPTPQGDGAVPGREFLALLDRLGYRGPVSLEWERFWQPSAPSLDTALGAAAAFLRDAPPTAN